MDSGRPEHELEATVGHRVGELDGERGAYARGWEPETDSATSRSAWTVFVATGPQQIASRHPFLPHQKSRSYSEPCTSFVSGPSQLSNMSFHDAGRAVCSISRSVNVSDRTFRPIPTFTSSTSPSSSASFDLGELFVSALFLCLATSIHRTAPGRAAALKHRIPNVPSFTSSQLGRSLSITHSAALLRNSPSVTRRARIVPHVDHLRKSESCPFLSPTSCQLPLQRIRLDRSIIAQRQSIHSASSGCGGDYWPNGRMTRPLLINGDWTSL